MLSRTLCGGLPSPTKAYFKGNPNNRLMGYCLYEFSNEAYRNANWGLFIDSGNVLYSEQLGLLRSTQRQHGMNLHGHSGQAVIQYFDGHAAVKCGGF